MNNSIKQIHMDLLLFPKLGTIIYLIFASCISMGQNFSKINIEEVWRVTNAEDASEIVLTVIDGGVLLGHELLTDNQWENNNEKMINHIDDDNNGFIDDRYGWNFDLNNNDVSNSNSGNWHGTPVNGILGSIINNPVWDADSKMKIMNVVKADNINGIISSLSYIHQMRKTYNETDGEKGVFVVAVNCSWGKNQLWADDYPDWCAMYDSLGQEGVLAISSVPNNNIDIDVTGDMPTTCLSDFLITVTNSDEQDYKVFDAAYGERSVDIAAPGQNSYTILNTGTHGYFGGTSAAAPYVTGVIGLLYALPSEKMKKAIRESPAETALLIKSVIMAGAEKNNFLTNITVTGGRLDAYSSMKLLLDYYDEQHLYQDVFHEFQVLKIFPNPAQDYTQLVLESNKNKPIKIILSDFNGKTMQVSEHTINEGIHRITIDLTLIPKGFYILSVLSDGEQRSLKLIIH